jgi:hypothetical protein
MIAPGYAIYNSAPCEGQQIGEVWLSGYDVPPANTWTTQCVRLVGSDIVRQLSVQALDPTSGVRNARLVQGCECTRELKRWTTCGIDFQGHGGGSACETRNADGGF